MGHSFVTASKSVSGDPILLTSVICTPTTQSAATVIVYNATAATADTDVLRLRSSLNGGSAVWHDKNGIELDSMYVALSSAFATVVWD